MNPFVDHALVEDRGHDVLGAPERLQAFDAGEGVGDDADHADLRVVLLEPPAEARDGAAGADAGDHVGEPAACLLQDLHRRRLVVRAPVVLVAVLVAEEVAVGVGLVPAVHLAQRLVVALEGVRVHEPGAVRQHPLLPLGAGVVGDHDLDGVADDPADHRVGDSRVTGGAVEDGPAGLEAAVGQGAEQHPEHRPILERAAGVERLQLDEHLDPGQLVTENVERHERRSADGPQDRVTVQQAFDPGVPGHDR